MLLVGLFGVGLALTFLPWKQVAVGVAVLALIWLGRVLSEAPDPVLVLSAPALLLGWGLGLLIRRTIAERRAL